MTEPSLAPTPEHTDPIQGFRFVADYRSPSGAIRTVDIWAHDWDEAQAHVWALKNTLTLSGQVFAREDMIGGVQ